MTDAGRIHDGLGSRIAGNLAAWDLPERMAWALFVAPLVMVPAAVLVALAEHPVFYAATVEDGLVEWAQVGALLIAGGAYVMIARKVWQTGVRTTAVVALVCAVAVVSIAGEEISWGQRLLGWATPAELEAINVQGETTIHNIGALATASNLAQFAAAGYGAALPILALLPSVPARIRNSYLLPPVALVSFFLGAFLYWAARIPLEPWRAVRRASEIMELSFYAGLALFAWLSLRRVTAQSEPGDTAK